MTGIDNWYLENLACPRDHLPLAFSAGRLACSAGHAYPVVDGVPVMLLDGVPQTTWMAEASLRRAWEPRAAESGTAELYLDTLGIIDAERRGIVELAASASHPIDPVVSFLVGATSGYMYADLIGKLPGYPIPDLRLPAGNGKRLLDVGCSWGRWSVAAARKGYAVTGIDPSLGAVMAARRMARVLRVDPRFVVADARHLPFPPAAFDTAFSYSVLQHFAPGDTLSALREVSRVLAPGGSSMIQMASAYGIRSLYHQLRRGMRVPEAFDVRYWRPGELQRVFGRSIGRTRLSADCYFGLGLQSADAAMMGPARKFLLKLSESLVRLSRRLPVLAYLADSLYVTSIACAE